ncbi:hypothetical protein Hamer_G000527, partial [Homarus americanus]
MIGGDSTNTNTGVVWRRHSSIGEVARSQVPLDDLSAPCKRAPPEALNHQAGRPCNSPVSFNFKPVEGIEDIIELPVEIVKSLSTDQHSCYLLIKAIRSGSLSPELVGLKCGPLNHSSWFTTAQAILPLWMREHGLKGEVLRRLEVLVKFCLNFYFKMYYIKVKHHLKFGPEHVVSSLRLLRNQTSKVKNIISAAVIRGAYHAHPENILDSFLSSEDQHQRYFGVRQIEKIRKGRDFGDATVRPHENPKVNLQATSPEDLINLESENI